MEQKLNDLHFIGNKELLDNQKTAFLCSRNIPASVVLKAYDWAIEQREQGRCVISGFHSTIEKDVFHYLLKGEQPIILVLARELKQRFAPEINEAVNANRLLIISPFQNTTRITRQTSLKRNTLMLDLADEILVAYAAPGGMLWQLVQPKLFERKKMFTFDVPENEGLIQSGVEIWD